MKTAMEWAKEISPCIAEPCENGAINGKCVGCQRADAIAAALTEFAAQAVREHVDEMVRLENEIDDLVIALDESVKLQSHQAKMLNTYDGGERRQFDSGADWVLRLIDCGAIGERARVTAIAAIRSRSEGR